MNLNPSMENLDSSVLGVGTNLVVLSTQHLQNTTWKHFNEKYQSVSDLQRPDIQQKFLLFLFGDSEKSLYTKLCSRCNFRSHKNLSV